MSGKAQERKDVKLSSVEQIAVEASGFDVLYPPTEKIPTIIVNNFPALGKLAAMRFIEWVQHNLGGVISLPTGKTPEHFIKWVMRLLDGWDSDEIQDELKSVGIDPAARPDMSSLHFVQIDEFYPMDSSQENSFHHYVKEFYLKGFGLDPEKALLIDSSSIGLDAGEKLGDVWPGNMVDLSLRYRQATCQCERRRKALLERVDQWCMEYEQKIRDLGGIGFFLGGIGPDGHIGFNISGSDHNSTTRLCPINYETQAAAATDLGGIEIARKSLVITIGLGTITWNPDCTCIIIAAGEAKARLTAGAIQSEMDIRIPATVLHDLPNARFYLSRGAASLLSERQVRLLERCEVIGDDQVERVLVDLVCRKHKKLEDLSTEDFQSDAYASVVLSKRSEGAGALATMVRDRLIAKIEKGLGVHKNSKILHTEPHHDDIMLGYFAQLVRHFRRATNTHHFVTLTSGFTAVTNAFMREQIENLQRFLHGDKFQSFIGDGYFTAENMTARNRDVWQYLDGVAANSEDDMDEGCARRLLRNLMELYGAGLADIIDDKLAGLGDYFATTYPGKKDPEDIQKLKGMCREWEAECVWGYYGWQCQNVHHLRLGFYTGDIFTKEPTMDNDVPPIVELLDEVDPNIVTVAFDPEASGPDTHYKVMQATAEAIRAHLDSHAGKDIRVWGYRNVWYRFDPSEVNLFVPVTLSMFAITHNAFMKSFITQKDASFPSHEHDGPFSELAQQVQVSQYQKIKTCLGRGWFHNHDSALVRATRGFVFLKDMDADEFFQSCRELKRSVEDA